MYDATYTYSNSWFEKPLQSTDSQLLNSLFETFSNVNFSEQRNNTFNTELDRLVLNSVDPYLYHMYDKVVKDCVNGRAHNQDMNELHVDENLEV